MANNTPPASTLDPNTINGTGWVQISRISAGSRILLCRQFESQQQPGGSTSTAASSTASQRAPQMPPRLGSRLQDRRFCITSIVIDPGKSRERSKNTLMIKHGSLLKPRSLFFRQSLAGRMSELPNQPTEFTYAC
ncbi:hypothetical protein CIHG_00062 [Coccidioides immitis H538.4]|uniref:Uncharacterized protein n=3 Tax=Coccidioides immitis TaxID=5501 RepID=A0A0J8TVY9_COCIT|nr:hypothetical protein CIRG_06885 [Coccidioides immitis RMSCC 2394]KMU78062.1 hypothetical protein CISG_06824 [Coccidioides immitis RMSCC 3703]KMU82276.1 hypothetical protein CIHG_00062 [Coccidioides immitis H538.4]